MGTVMSIPVAEPKAESFGLPPTVPHLIAKLRAMDPALRATVTNRKQTER